MKHNTKFTYFTTWTQSVAAILECCISGNINQENQPKEYQRHYYFKKASRNYRVPVNLVQASLSPSLVLLRQLLHSMFSIIYFN